VPEDIAMDALRLTVEEQRQLSETLRQTQDARMYKRVLAVLECGRGKGVTEVAHALNVTPQSVHNWLNRYRHAGQPAALDDAPKSGRPRKADHMVEALLEALMLLAPERCGYAATHWTLPLLTEQVCQKLGRPCCEKTIRRCLRRLGYVWEQPRYVLAPDSPHEKKKPAAARVWQLAKSLSQ
jgi:transposase